METEQWSCHLIDQPAPNYLGVLITSFDKILITVSSLTKNNGSVTLPLIDLTIIAITYSR